MKPSLDPPHPTLSLDLVCPSTHVLYTLPYKVLPLTGMHIFFGGVPPLPYIVIGIGHSVQFLLVVSWVTPHLVPPLVFLPVLSLSLFCLPPPTP